MRAELIDYMGSDLTCVNAARVSFDKESEWEGKKELNEDGGYFDRVLSDRDAKLISYLAKHNHFTPFTHPQITLRETVPIFVARQRFKHVVGFTYNEVSRRYVDDDPEFYMPEVWRSRPDGSVKQGSGGAHKDSEEWKEDYYLQIVKPALQMYRDMVFTGIAPEQARMVLPQSMYTSYYVTGSLAAFARMCKLRLDPHAQQEIQELAKMVSDIIEPLYPVSWKALMEG